MLLPCCGFYRGNNLTGNAKFRKSPERRELVLPEVSYGFVKTNHSLLDYILPVGTYKEIGPGLRPYKILVLAYQVFRRLTVAFLCLLYHFLIKHHFVMLICSFIVGLRFHRHRLHSSKGICPPLNHTIIIYMCFLIVKPDLWLFQPFLEFPRHFRAKTSVHRINTVRAPSDHSLFNIPVTALHKAL
jgi:hypothetical protein